MKESSFYPITIYRQILLTKDFDGWTAEVQGLPATRVEKHRYKQEAIDAAIDKARYLLEGFHQEAEQA